MIAMFGQSLFKCFHSHYDRNVNVQPVNLRLPEIKLQKLMARTLIIKVLASGAQPIALFANLDVEFFPTWSRISQGIREEALKIKKMV
jgi:hypothetical protein